MEFDGDVIFSVVVKIRKNLLIESRSLSTREKKQHRLTVKKQMYSNIFNLLVAKNDLYLHKIYISLATTTPASTKYVIHIAEKQ